MKRKILIVEDDVVMATTLKRLIEKNIRQECLIALNLRCGANLLEEEGVEVVILDRLLPDGDGLELLRQMRESNTGVRFFILSDMGKVQEVERGLLAGAWDYLPKPFSRIEFLERLKRLLYVTGGDERERYKIRENVVFSPEERKLLIDGRAHNLTLTDCRILEYLYQNQNFLVTRDALRSAIWDISDDISENAISAKIYRLRRKMGQYRDCLKTCHKFGYQLQTTNRMMARTMMA